MINFSLSLRTRFVAALVVLGLVAGFAGVVGSAGASKASAASGPAYCGALNMVHDAAMGNGFVGSGQANDPMVHDATQGTQGNAGMFIAVGNTCP